MKISTDTTVHKIWNEDSGQILIDLTGNPWAFDKVLSAFLTEKQLDKVHDQDITVRINKNRLAEGLAEYERQKKIYRLV